MKKVYVTFEQIRVNEDIWELDDEEFEKLQGLDYEEKVKEIKKQLDPNNFYVDSEQLIRFEEVVI